MAYGQPSRTTLIENTWEFAGWGKRIVLPPISEAELAVDGVIERPVILGQWHATALAANNCVGSVFYAIGLVTATSGKLAPFCLLAATLLLFPYGRLMSEVMGCLPTDGGSYGVLLASGPKRAAAVAGILIMMDYIMTATVAVGSSAAYIDYKWGLGGGAQGVFWLALGFLGFAFGVCVVFGMQGASHVSLAVFVLHMLTMSALVIACLVHIPRAGATVLRDNWNTGPINGNYARDLLYGFSASIIAVTGFETIPNFVEEQKPGVFPKALRNLALVVTLLNPAICLLGLCLVPLAAFRVSTNAMLSVFAEVAGGEALSTLVSLDAVIILCGGAIGAFGTVSGIVAALARDKLMPSWITRQTKRTHAYPYAAMFFLGATAVLWAAFRGNLTTISCLFGLTFLLVMLSYAVCNLLLKYKRSRMTRPVAVGVLLVLACAAAILVAVVGSIVQTPIALVYFGITFTLCAAPVLFLTNQMSVYRMLIFLADQASRGDADAAWLRVGRWAVARAQRLRSTPVIFYTNHDQIHVLNKAVIYVAQNETSGWLRFVHCYDPADPAAIPANLAHHCRVLDYAYPKIRIDLILVPTRFSAQTAVCIAKRLGVERNMCLMSAPGEKLGPVSAFGGIRIIML
ncbi:hypothetical protein CXG81DRAFT_11776 [Caulochytrium protostelioides]|uniref:Amino acid permease/ SLC12A domain-containing protein n=1 Tax=Caulochytrium protostelioides TaxID=1555241 RepID=A0A4P9X8J0_9FUNG|nr:hypothetical protein CXG81DRAFT_11776 [Caulochytrium protostelioides]|eukprot:RKP01575.1 hypothetical protein CXG81DRAFT_11776 [Caulochytrium protostelioides]